MEKLLKWLAICTNGQVVEIVKSNRLAEIAKLNG